MKRLSILILLIILFFQSTTFAEMIVLRTGETVNGEIIEQTDNYIKVLIDLGFDKASYVFYLDEVKSINDMIVDVVLSSSIVQGLKWFVDDEYGFQVAFFEGWYIVVGQERIKQRIKDIKNWQSLKFPDSAKYNPQAVEFAKKISTAMAEELSLAITPYLAGYREKPVKFYQEQRPIPAIDLQIKEGVSANILMDEKDKAELAVSAIGGKFIEHPVFKEIRGEKMLCYSMQYEESKEIGEVVISQCEIVHNQNKLSFHLLSKVEDFDENQIEFIKVLNSLEWRQKQ